MHILEALRATAARTPGKLAIAYNGRAVSYGDFWRMICAAAGSLRPHLPERGLALIAVVDSLEGWILLLALRALGLDTAVVRDGPQAALFQGLAAACLVTLRGEHWPDLAAPAGVLRLEVTAPSAASLPAEAPPLEIADPPGDGAVLTSGTTGRPKIVLSRGRARTEILLERNRRYEALGEGFSPMGEASVLAMLDFGLHTAAGQSQPMFVWALGGAVVMQQGQDFQTALAWPGLTHALATPWALIRLVRLPEDAFPFRPDLQLTIIAGAVTPSLIRQVQARLTPRILVNLSSTEAGGWARTIVRTDEDLTWYQLDPSRRVEVVDDAGRPLGPGQLGRVRVARRDDGERRYIGGDGGAGAIFDGGWFYPGDLGVLDGRGRLALHGRDSDVIHIDGDKYPAGPWEQAIQDRLGCAGVCLLSGRFQGEAETLHLFIQPAGPITADALQQTLQETLSGFPSVHVHRVDSLPRTSMGKVRRFVLAQALHEGRLHL
ncbi:MAG TPA: AMP-binding protein [Caulobacteraceae bacterium]|nr:AMP-binding protein [Caulobacteraceae bacterium]